MFDRRQLLRGAAALAAARFTSAAMASRVDERPGAAGNDPFPAGVASGDPATDGFVLWTRLADAATDRLVGYEIATDEGFRRIVRKGNALAPAGRGGSVHLEVGGLQPSRPYFYRFHFAGVASRVGRTLTAPMRSDLLRLALTSCQHWEQGWFSAYRDMVARQADIVVQVGDYIYEKSFGSGPDVRSFGAPEPRTLADYRARYALYRTDPDLAAAHAALPFVVTWDDHEVENDYAGDAGVATIDPRVFIARRAAAYQAYFEYMPLRPSILRPGGEVRLYRRLGWGDLATLHILDTRQYRTPHPCATAAQRGGQAVVGCAAVTDPRATMLGTAQEQWLARGLAHETGRWSLLAQQTLFARLFLPQRSDASYSDIWDGYAATRDRTLAALTNPAVRNPVVLSGDVHSFWLNDLRHDFTRPETPVVASEVVTSCLASRNGPVALFGPAERLNPHVRYLDNANAGYTMLDVTRDHIGIDLRRVDRLADPESGCSSLRTATIVDRKPGFGG